MGVDVVLNLILWALQVLLAIIFLSHGRLMISPPNPLPERMAKRIRFIVDLSPDFRRFIGGAELGAAIGLILPGAFGILPWITALAATGLAVVMLGAILFHVRRREFPNLILNGLLLALSAFVAYERWILLPR